MIQNFSFQGAKYRVTHKEYDSRAQNLRQGIVMKTSFGTQVSQIGLGSFVDINIFVIKYCFI